MAAVGRRTPGTPMIVLSEGSSRTRGRSAQGMNIAAGKAVAEAVRTTLGPKGMDKMLVDATGDVVITNDGVTILEEMDIEHPAAQMIVEVAQTQEEEVGDGTTTAAVLAGQLLARAEDLLYQDVHPTTVVEGYREAARIAGEAIDDLVDEDVDDALLARVAASSMTGKGAGTATADSLADLVVRAVRRVEGDGGVDRDDVHVRAQVGAGASATELVEGVVVKKSPASDSMPRLVEDATVALLESKLEVRTSEVGAEYTITSVDQLDAALAAEDEELRGYAAVLVDAGVDVVFSTKSVEDRVVSLLDAAGILVVDNVKNADRTALARATGATALKTVADLDEADLGHADAVRVETYGDDDLVFVEGGAATAAVTLFVRGSTEHVVTELERAVVDSVDAVVAALRGGGVVPGAGATEIAVAERVRDEAAGIEGRKQLAVEAFADAVDAVPRTLAENVGLDPIDALVDLRTRHDATGRAGIIVVGQSGEIVDPIEEGVVDPASVKRGAIGAATEAAAMILRIDDVIAAS